MEVTGCIKIVETRIANNKDELMKHYSDFLDQGYEGAMARNLNSPYENKRSKHLQKLKLFQDAEFKVISVIEGRGKYSDNIGSFVCEIPKDFDKHGYRTFKAKPSGDLKYWQKVYKNDEWKDKVLTVKFQNYSNKNHVPRFPVGVRLRGIDE